MLKSNGFVTEPTSSSTLHEPSVILVDVPTPRSFRRSAALALLPLLAGCSLMPQAGPERRVEAPYAPAVSQRGDVLAIGIGRDARQYRSTSECDRDPDNCETYAFDAVLAPGVYGVRVDYYEGGDYLVVVPGSGDALTGARPVLSPDRRLMASAITSEAYETSAEGLHVWTVREGTKEIFAANPDELREASLPAYPEHLAWLTNTCLTFSVVSGDGPPDTSPRRELYLVKSTTGWQLLDARPPSC